MVRGGSVLHLLTDVLQSEFINRQGLAHSSSSFSQSARHRGIDFAQHRQEFVAHPISAIVGVGVGGIFHKGLVMQAKIC